MSQESYHADSKSNGHFLYSGTGSYELTDDVSDANQGSHAYSYTEWSHVETEMRQAEWMKAAGQQTMTAANFGLMLGFTDLPAIPRGSAARIVVKPRKWDYYFFGRVTSNPHNAARSLQNLKDLTTLGINDTPAGREALTRLLEIGLHHPEISRHVTQYGITITRRVPVSKLGVIEVKYFYHGGDMSALPEISTIIPKIF